MTIFLLAVPAVVLLLFLVWASSSICSGVYLKAICRKAKGSGQLALSFDDGPDPERTPKLLDLLDSFGAKASFFLVGSRVEGREALVKEIVDRGHSLGNHGYLHRWNFPLMAARDIAAEISRTSVLLEKISGTDVRYFRPPFGVTNPRVARGCRRSRMKVIGWSIRSMDTREEDAGKVVRRVIKKLGDGDILLLHDHSAHVLEILGEILPLIEQQGLKCVNLDTFLDDTQ